MLSASTCYTTSANLAAIGNVLAQSSNIFVIDIANFVATETAWLLLELLIERSSLRGLVLGLLERSVITCSHCGAPLRVPCFTQEWIDGGLERWFVVGSGCPPTAGG